jgi:hypothetical protein
MVCLLCAGTAMAGTSIGTSTQTLWGQTYGTETWFLGDDAPPFDPLNPEFFEPEGMTFFNGSLYVSGDSDETDPTLVQYMPGSMGILSSPNPIALTAQGSVWGAEGVTVNTSGSGYGSFDLVAGAPILVSVESGNDPDADFNDVVGAINTGFAPAEVEAIHQPFVDFDPDDIAYVSSLDQFAVVNDPNRADFYNHDATELTPAGFSLTISGGLEIGDAKGLAVVSEGFAELVLGMDVTGQALLVAYESNHLGMFDLNGDMLGSIQEFTSGLLPPESAESEIEAVAVDEMNQLIYVGDEAGLSVTVIRVPEPATLAILALGAVVGLGRRR